MDRKRAKDEVKRYLQSYLESRSINTKANFSCLNPEHNDSNPSMSYDKKRNKVHCFGCGADYDLIDLIGIEYGITDPGDKFKKAYELYNITVDSAEDDFTYRDNTKYQNKHKNEQYTHNSIQTNISDTQSAAPGLAEYLNKAHANVVNTDYFKDRGISQEVIDRFKLGYDEKFNNRSTGGKTWQAVIIPTGNNSYVIRNTDKTAAASDRYRKQGSANILNQEALKKTTDKSIFIVEGEIDALSIIAAGGEAVALGSTAGANHFLEVIKSNRPQQPLIIALDNDEAGETAAQVLENGLKQLNIPAYTFKPHGDYKDANEALINDTSAFTLKVTEAGAGIAEYIKSIERNKYLQTSAVNHIKDFLDGIAASADTPYISTGFNLLDAALDGGLYEGLYIVGAISSLGKTTLITQICDQIAHESTDVLIFSLEMARTELMAKSISRLTLINVLNNRHDMGNAKTSRGITTGRKWAYYNDTEKSIIQQSVETYAKYADHIYIHEGIGDIGALQIREIVQKHIEYTGKRPVIVIDYLQILAPYNDRATDKQNTDKAVLELKRISRDFKIPVIGISSFNRENYSKAVSMEAFKESGAVEYSSDVLIGLQFKGAGSKEFDAMKEKAKEPRNVELVILKNRNGKTGTRIELNYYPMFNYFKEV